MTAIPDWIRNRQGQGNGVLRSLQRWASSWTLPPTQGSEDLELQVIDHAPHSSIPLEDPVYMPTTEPLPRKARPWKSWLLWGLFSITVLTTAIVLAFMIVLRIQWKMAIDTPGKIVTWNNTGEVIVKPIRAKRSMENSVTQHLAWHHIPQGHYLQPYPKPILSKERVLAFSHLILLDVNTLAQDLGIKSTKGRDLLSFMLDEEMEALQDKTLNFEIPIDQPDTQSQYVEKMCYQEFKHCYYLDFGETRRFPVPNIQADYCPIPSEDMPLREQACWKYWNPLPLRVPSNWTPPAAEKEYQTYSVPFAESDAAGVVFCSDRLYNENAWYATNISRNDQHDIYKEIMKQYLDQQSKFNDSALPLDWNDKGKAEIFKSWGAGSFCRYPEGVVLLNSTYYQWSLREGDCGIYKNTSCEVCKNLTEKSIVKHPYACSQWQIKTGDEMIKYCNDDNTWCAIASNMSSASVTPDKGYLAFKQHFPSCPCIQGIPIRNKTTSIYSFYGECVKQGVQYDLKDVVDKLKKKLVVKNQDARLMTLTDAFLPVEEPITFTNMTYASKSVRAKGEACLPTTKGRRKRSTNIGNIQEAGLAMTKAISILAKVTDLNNQEISKGIHLLRDHIVTLMEATIDDISSLGEIAKVQWLHTHISALVQNLVNGKVPWNVFRHDWIQDQLNVSDSLMNIIRHTASTTLFAITKGPNRWDLELYNELIVPDKVYTRNWEIVNEGRLVLQGKYLTHIWVVPPYNMINQDCEGLKYLQLKGCSSTDYLICEEIILQKPCGNGSEYSNCPIKAKSEDRPYLKVTPLKNGSYIVLTDEEDCRIPPLEPIILTVNQTTICYNHTFKKPLKQEETTSLLRGHIPDLSLRLPHLVGIIAQLKGIEIHLTSTWDSIKDQINRARDTLLRLDVHEGDFPEWIKQVAESLSDVWPAAAQVLNHVGTFLGKVANGIFGSTIGILSYLKPVLLFLFIIIVIVIIAKILSWLPTTKKTQ